MAEAVPTVPRRGNSRAAFDELAGTSNNNPTPNDDPKDKDTTSDATNDTTTDDDDDLSNFDPADDQPSDAAIPASRRTNNDSDGDSAGSALMRATSARGSVTCPKCGNVWPLQNRFRGGVIPCTCGRRITVAPPTA